MFDTFIAELRETHALQRELLILLGSIVDQNQHILQMVMDDDEEPTEYMDGRPIHNGRSGWG